MKIDNATIGVLRNFAKISPSIIVQEGNVLKTMSPTKTIMAKATVPTNFDKKFAIYNLDRFISTISLFNNPDFKFEDNHVKITDENRETKLLYSDENTITKLPEKEIKLPSVDVSFVLTNENLKLAEKAAGVMQLPEFMVVGDGVNIYLQVGDSKNPNGDNFSIQIGDTDKMFKAIFKFENIKIIPGEYAVKLSSKGISHFLGNEAEYWIVIEQHSTF